jgi:hypothetical protein
MKYQPVEMNTVLIKLNEALRAGRSEMDTIEKLNGYTVTSRQATKRFNIVTFAALVTL